ncbi:sacsin-like [Microcaecilia unicolor]|uniref:Sacsin-like n=1 Tax=Microcaecilia unicolor TaxID=1415580 RepID=A0A6P7Y567_9AMPH|nr:sacsin-like [Microcaecilia unicolor]
MQGKDVIRLVRITILHEYVGCRTYDLPPSTAVKDIKQLLYTETDFPVSEQHLWHNNKELCDWTKIGDLVHSPNHGVFLNLQSNGLKGGAWENVVQEVAGKTTLFANKNKAGNL